jgi:hypothetical protein
MNIDFNSTTAAWFSLVTAVASLVTAFFAFLAAKKSSDAAHNSFRLNAAREWAERVSGINSDFALITSTYERLKPVVTAKFAKAGHSQESSAQIEVTTRMENDLLRAKKIKDEYPMGSVIGHVLATANSQSFPALIATLESNRAEMAVIRVQFQSQVATFTE